MLDSDGGLWWFALCANAHISESRYGAPDFLVSDLDVGPPCCSGLGDQGWRRFVEQIVAIGRPSPVFRVGDEAPGDWIAMHVRELFDALVVGEDVEVIVARLPEGTL